MPRVYLAGPIDHDPARTLHMEGWRHADWTLIPGIRYWCPICMAVGHEAAFIMVNNMTSLITADAVVAYFDTGVASFGTPIEINERAKRSPGSLFLVHRGPPGLFVQTLESNGEIIVGRSFEEAKRWLIAYLK